LLAEVYRTYAARCFKANAMDFDDLLLNTNILFRDFPDVLVKYQERFSYVLVDEYQDTNYSQYLIVKKLAASHQNICVVGDDAQSIYSSGEPGLKIFSSLKTTMLITSFLNLNKTTDRLRQLLMLQIQSLLI